MLISAKNEVILNFNTYKDILTEIFYPQMVQCGKIMPSHIVKTLLNSTGVHNEGIENLISIGPTVVRRSIPSVTSFTLNMRSKFETANSIS